MYSLSPVFAHQCKLHVEDLLLHVLFVADPRELLVSDPSMVWFQYPDVRVSLFQPPDPCQPLVSDLSMVSFQYPDVRMSLFQPPARLYRTLIF